MSEEPIRSLADFAKKKEQERPTYVDFHVHVVRTIDRNVASVMQDLHLDTAQAQFSSIQDLEGTITPLFPELRPPFSGALRVSPFNVVRSIEIVRHQPLPDVAANGATTAPLVEKFWFRDDLGELNLFNCHVHVRQQEERKDRRLSETVNITINIVLEDHLRWVETGVIDISMTLDGIKATLSWPDVEVNAYRKWRLPIAWRGLNFTDTSDALSKAVIQKPLSIPPFHERESSNDRRSSNERPRKRDVLLGKK